MHVCMYDWIATLHTGNEDNTVNQLSRNYEEPALPWVTRLHPLRLQ